jgi:hypothetical protein
MSDDDAMQAISTVAADRKLTHFKTRADKVVGHGAGLHKCIMYAILQAGPWSRTRSGTNI